METMGPLLLRKPPPCSPETIQPAVSPVQEPEEQNEELALEQGKETSLPGSAGSFEEPSVDDYPVLNEPEPEPEPDAIIDWLIHKRGDNKRETE